MPATGYVGRVGRVGLSPGRSRWWTGAAYRLDGVQAGAVVDFVRNRALLGATACAPSSLLTISGSDKWVEQADGSLLRVAAGTIARRWDAAVGRYRARFEGPATNLLLNSASLAPQGVTVAAAIHVLSFFGTGAITLSGASSGVVSGTGAAVRTSFAFTPSAGTLTLAVAGQVSNAQLETGAVASSYIPTAAATVTRSADIVSFSAAVAAILQGAGAAVAFRGDAPVGFTGTPGRTFIAGNPGILLRQSTAGALALEGVAGALSTTATGYMPGPIAFLAGWGASGRRISQSGSTPDADGAVVSYPRTAISIGPQAGMYTGQILDVDEIDMWSLPDRPSSSGAQEQARAWR